LVFHYPPTHSLGKAKVVREFSGVCTVDTPFRIFSRFGNEHLAFSGREF
jgi:hypothetical protein